MRRLILATFATLAFSTTAFADEPDPTPTPNPNPSPNPSPNPIPSSIVDEDLPLRFRDMLRLEASRARTGRYFSGGLGIVGSGGIAALGVLSLTTADPSDTLQKDYSYLIIATGALGVISSLFGLIGQTPIERLYESYAPFADDKKFPADQRLREGEDALRQMAESDASARRINGITDIVASAVLGGFAIWLGTTSLVPSQDRALLGGLMGVSSLVSLGAGIGQLWYQRGPAEVALEHWEASRGLRREARMVPMLMPSVHGVVGSLAIIY